MALHGQFATEADIMRLYGMTRSAVLTRAYRYQWRRLTVNGIKCYSWIDVDRSVSDAYLARHDNPDDPPQRIPARIIGTTSSTVKHPDRPAAVRTVPGAGTH